jgi:aspartyl-tRNA(Asn)/glutamyl-tRNA(Gln) amidotransferase subunit A
MGAVQTFEEVHMSQDETAFLSAAEIARAVRGKELSPVEVTEAYLDRAQRLNPSLNAYITITGERALEEAKEIERRLMVGDVKGSLFGVPVAVKDQYLTRDIRTTCGSSLFSDFVPSEDAEVVTRLRESGAILLGKLNLSALAASEEDGLPWGKARNPWDLARHPGGSSTGSGVALAAHLCGASVGEDTAGSGRNPASWSGVTGLRPTYGRISRYGIMPVCWYLDSAAPMGKTVEDTALVLEAIAGYDPKDSYSSKRPVPHYTAQLDNPIKGLRIGVLSELNNDGVDPEVRKLLTDAVDVLRSLGAKVDEVSVPMMNFGGDLYMMLGFLEAYNVHARTLRAKPEGFAQLLRAWLRARALVPAALEKDVLSARSLLRRELLDTFRSFDLLLSPTTNTPAPISQGHITNKPMTHEMEAAVSGWVNYCAGYAMAAMPAISVPCGFTASEKPLPVGMQLGGPPHSEGRLLQVAHAYQQATTWHTRRSPASQQ